MNWSVSAGLAKATGDYSGIQARETPDGWWLIDWRPTEGKVRAWGPYRTYGSAMVAAEKRFERGES